MKQTGIPTVKLSMLNRFWSGIALRRKQRKLDKAIAFLKSCGLVPVRMVLVADNRYIVGPDGLYYLVSPKGTKPSPHHAHRPTTADRPELKVVK
jgi:hypothetical protein